jgi:hypothetical protein
MKNAICRVANCFLIIDLHDYNNNNSYYIVLAFFVQAEQKKLRCNDIWRLGAQEQSRTAIGRDADTIPRRLETLPNLYTVALEDGLKERPNM